MDLDTIDYTSQYTELYIDCEKRKLNQILLNQVFHREEKSYQK